MAVPSSSDRARRPFLLSLSLFLLLSALLVLLFIFLDPSPGTLTFLPSRLSGSAPALAPIVPQQQSTATILTPGTPPRAQPAAPPAQKAEENTAGRQPEATAGVESSKNRDPPRKDTNGGAADGTAGAGVVAAGEDDEEEAPVQVRWETCRVGRGVSAADYIPCLDNIRAIKALRTRRHMEHRERNCPVAPRPRCLVPLPAEYRTPVPWPRSRDMVRNSHRFACLLKCILVVDPLCFLLLLYDNN
ncbi:hypothetical protein EJB05_35968, partial [Eragrostis curvula]